MFLPSVQRRWSCDTRAARKMRAAENTNLPSGSVLRVFPKFSNNTSIPVRSVPSMGPRALAPGNCRASAKPFQSAEKALPPGPGDCARPQNERTDATGVRSPSTHRKAWRTQRKVVTRFAGLYMPSIPEKGNFSHGGRNMMRWHPPRILLTGWLRTQNHHGSHVK